HRGNDGSAGQNRSPPASLTGNELVRRRAALDQLADSIRTVGIQQAIVIRKVDGGATPYQLVAGERRWRASVLAGAPVIPAMLRDLTDAQVLEIQIIENSQREDVHPLEESDAFARFIATGTYGEGSDAAVAIAEKIGRPVAFVLGRLRLSQLIPQARKAFDEGFIALGHAELLAPLPEEDQMEHLRSLCEVDFNTWPREKDPAKFLSRMETARSNVATLRREIGRQSIPLWRAGWSLDDPEIVGRRGKCEGCPLRSDAGLLDLEGDDPKCLDPICFRLKRTQTVERAIARSQANGEVPLLIGDHEAQERNKAVLREYDGEISHYPQEGFHCAVAVSDSRDAKAGDTIYFRPRPGVKAATAQTAEEIETQKEARRNDLRTKKVGRLVAQMMIDRIAEAVMAASIGYVIPDIRDPSHLLGLVAMRVFRHAHGSTQKWVAEHFDELKGGAHNLDWSVVPAASLIRLLALTEMADSPLQTIAWGNVPDMTKRDGEGAKHVCQAFGLDFDSFLADARKAADEAVAKPKAPKKGKEAKSNG
ncbi:ParB/RepB/Spo0J family partition protein, partial [bacterium]